MWFKFYVKLNFTEWVWYCFFFSFYSIKEQPQLVLPKTNCFPFKCYLCDVYIINLSIDSYSSRMSNLIKILCRNRKNAQYSLVFDKKVFLPLAIFDIFKIIDSQLSLVESRIANSELLIWMLVSRYERKTYSKMFL